MKHFKKFFSYLVALTMVLSLAAFTGVKVHAEMGNTLTLSGTKTGHTYEVYQIFTGDLVEKDGNKVLSNVQWGTGVTSKTNADAANVAKRLDTNYKEQDKLTIDNLIDDLNLTKAFQTVDSTDSTTTIEGLPYGYYLVKDKDGTQNDKSDAYTKFIVQVVGKTTAAIKSDVPTLEKKVKDTNDSTGETSDWQDSADYDIGDSIPYKLTATLGTKYGDYKTYKMEFVDTLSTGLDYDDSVEYKVTVGNENGSDITKAFGKTVNGKTITWTCNDLKSVKDKDGKAVTINAGSNIIVTYNAKLNKNAVIGSAGNPNTAYLKYSNNPNYTGEGANSPEGQTPKDKNKVFTYKTVVNKVDQDKNSLAGAAFKLEKKQSDGSYKEVKAFTAGDATTFEFTGLDDGEYKLTETTTPAGYNTIVPIEFTISAEHDADSADPQLTKLTGNATTGKAEFTVEKVAGSLTTDVVNQKGSTLPSTGGMGTTLLYVAGGILVACAAAYVVMSRKHSTNK